MSDEQQRIQKIIDDILENQEDYQKLFEEVMDHQVTLHPLLGDSGLFPLEYMPGNVNECRLDDRPKFLTTGSDDPATHDASVAPKAFYTSRGIIMAPMYSRFSWLLNRNALLLGKDNLMEHLEGDWAVYTVPIMTLYADAASQLLRTGKVSITDTDTGCSVKYAIAEKAVTQKTLSFHNLREELQHESLSDKAIVVGNLAGTRPEFVEELLEWEAQGRLGKLIQVKTERLTEVTELVKPGEPNKLWMSDQPKVRSALWPANQLTVCDLKVGSLKLFRGEAPVPEEQAGKKAWLRFFNHTRTLAYQIGSCGLVVEPLSGEKKRMTYTIA